jgi:hypothetical protein
MVRNLAERDVVERGKMRAIGTIRSRAENTVKVSFNTIHGHLTPDSDELASLILLDIEAAGQGTKHIDIRMSFQSSEDEDHGIDPQVLNIVPSGEWCFDAQSDDQAQKGEATMDEIEVKGIKSVRNDDESGWPTVACWSSNQDVIFTVLQPAVLLRRRDNRAFKASLEVRVKIEGPRENHSISAQHFSTGRNVIEFNPNLPTLGEWPSKHDDLQSMMQG